MSFLKLHAEGQAARARTLRGGGSALLPAGHDAGSSWSPEGGFPRQTGKCSGSLSCGSAQTWKQILSRDWIEPGLMARQPVGRWVWGGSRLLPGKEVRQVCADACRGSCMDCRCSPPSLEFSLHRRLPRRKWIRYQDYSVRYQKASMPAPRAHLCKQHIKKLPGKWLWSSSGSGCGRTERGKVFFYSLLSLCRLSRPSWAGLPISHERMENGLPFLKGIRAMKI